MTYKIHNHRNIYAENAAAAGREKRKPGRLSWTQIGHADQQEGRVRARHNQQADHDQGQPEGSEERAVSGAAEDPGEAGGEEQVWEELDRSSGPGRSYHLL